MRDILISSAVFVACLLLALVSQLVSPTSVLAAPPGDAGAASLSSAAAVASQQARGLGRYELDPEDPNPTLFAMASDSASPSSSASRSSVKLPSPSATTQSLGVRVGAMWRTKLERQGLARAAPAGGYHYRPAIQR
jgi:peptidylprolyl isomerase